MSIFSNIFGKIVSLGKAITGHADAPAPEAPSTPATAPTASAPVAPAPTPISEVDVTAILDGLAKKNPEKLDWRRSIVDLMKLLDLDSSFSQRKELAKELGYTGDFGDSATMNIWLHKQVLTKLAANGGKVPKELLD